MKTEKAIERIKAFRDYLCAGNPIWDVGECKEAFDIAIAAMEQRWLPAADVPDINDGDMISREAVIKLILSGRVGDDSRFECPAECNGMLEWAADEVAKMPTADVPDRKVGKWIKDGVAYSLYKCSACNDFCVVAGWANCIPEEQMYKGFKFCPNCGARMRGDEG